MDNNIATNTVPSNTPYAPNKKIGKFKASKMIVIESWRILVQDKELAFFPILTCIVSLIFLVVLGAVLFYSFMAVGSDAIKSLSEAGSSVLFYAILFVYYLGMFFVANYFMAGMYFIVHARFMGQNFSFSDGIRNANNVLGKIFIWSLISATVGLVLRIIADKSKLIGKIVAVIFGAAWNILTYFSLPSLIIGNMSVKDSFKESANLIRKTWGEVIIVNFGVGLFFSLITVVVIALSIGIVILVPTSNTLILVGILLIIFMIVMTIISTTLSSIFKLALYEFAKTGSVPQGYTAELLQGAIKQSS